MPPMAPASPGCFLPFPQAGLAGEALTFLMLNHPYAENRKLVPSLTHASPVF